MLTPVKWESIISSHNSLFLFTHPSSSNHKTLRSEMNWDIRPSQWLPGQNQALRISSWPPSMAPWLPRRNITNMKRSSFKALPGIRARAVCHSWYSLCYHIAREKTFSNQLLSYLFARLFNGTLYPAEMKCAWEEGRRAPHAWLVLPFYGGHLITLDPSSRLHGPRQ